MTTLKRPTLPRCYYVISTCRNEGLSWVTGRKQSHSNFPPSQRHNKADTPSENIFRSGSWGVLFCTSYRQCLELRHPRCVCNIKVQCKSKHNKLIVTMLLIERHVSAYSEAIIRFSKLYETTYHGFKLLDVEISSYILYGDIQRKNCKVRSCDGVPPGTPSQLRTL